MTRNAILAPEHLDWTELQQHAHNAPESEQPKQSLQLEQPKQQQQQQQQQVVAFESTTVSQDDKVIQPELKQGSGKLSRPNNNVEKLKRGLTNFMNQLNPAPFFVPSHYHEQQAADPQAKLNGKEANEGGKVTLGSGKLATQLGPQPSAELAAIVNADPSVDVLIKGPIRVAQTRPIGGPLRWGRRR